MKKQLLIVMLSGLVVTAFGQDTETAPAAKKSSSSSEPMVNKKGHVILPEAGDIGIGMDAVPFFRYAGNLMNANTNNSPNTGFARVQESTIQNTLYGKYYLKDNMAIRARLRIGHTTNTTNAQVREDGIGFNVPDAFVSDERTQKINQNAVGAGVEFRRGHNRLQGYYGGEAIVSWGNTKDSISYGNDLSQSNATPTSTNFLGLNNNAGRVLSRESNQIFGWGVRAFGGVEYFIAPKISIGAEFGWGLQVTNRKNNKTTYERYTLEYEVYTIEDGNTSTINLDTDNFDGSINVFFHF